MVFFIDNALQVPVFCSDHSNKYFPYNKSDEECERDFF